MHKDMLYEGESMTHKLTYPPSFHKVLGKSMLEDFQVDYSFLHYSLKPNLSK